MWQWSDRKNVWLWRCISDRSCAFRPAGFRNTILHVLTVKSVHVSVSLKLAEIASMRIPGSDFFIANE